MNFSVNSFYKFKGNYSSQFTKDLIYLCTDYKLCNNKLLIYFMDDLGINYATSNPSDYDFFIKSGMNPNNWTKRNDNIRNKEDKVNSPKHYSWLKEVVGIEPIDICRHFNFNLGNALKYILRAGRKDEDGYTSKEKEIEDIKKAIWYLQNYIDGN